MMSYKMIIIELRSIPLCSLTNAHYPLRPSAENEDFPPLDKLPTEYRIDDEENLLFSETRISEALGADVTPLQPLQPMPKSPRSLSDIQSLVSDSSIYSTEKRMSGFGGDGRKEDLSFETLKKIMVGAQVRQNGSDLTVSIGAHVSFKMWLSTFRCVKVY